MGLQFALAARTVRIHGLLGADVLLQFHRQMTVVIAVLIFAHPTILMFWDSRFLALLNLLEAPLRAKLAVLACVLLLILIATSVWRRKLRLRYQVWQALHAVLAVLIVVFGLAHVLLIGYYVSEWWEKALWIAYSVAFIWIGLWVRVIAPIRRWQRRWRVVSVQDQPQHSHTITLEVVDPRAYGPAWFPVRRRPIRLDPQRSVPVRARVPPVLHLLQCRSDQSGRVHDQERARLHYPSARAAARPDRLPRRALGRLLPGPARRAGIRVPRRWGRCDPDAEHAHHAGRPRGSATVLADSRQSEVPRGHRKRRDRGAGVAAESDRGPRDQCTPPGMGRLHRACQHRAARRDPAAGSGPSCSTSCADRTP